MYLVWYTASVSKNSKFLIEKRSKGNPQSAPTNARKKRKRADHSGSTFDSFLEEEGIREEVEAVAIKRILAWQLKQAMQEQQKTKHSMAKQLLTSRSQLDRLLDPENVSVTLERNCQKAERRGNHAAPRKILSEFKIHSR